MNTGSVREIPVPVLLRRRLNVVSLDANGLSVSRVAVGFIYFRHLNLTYSFSSPLILNKEKKENPQKNCLNRLLQLKCFKIVKMDRFFDI